MKTNSLLPILGLAMLVLSITTSFSVASAATVYPTNDGFEQPDLGSGPSAFQYAPSSPGWIFSPANAGIAANGSDFKLAGATNGNHNGVTSTIGQAGFVQGGDGTLASLFGHFSQTLTLPSGHWFLLLSLEGRAAQDGANGVNVFLNGVQVDGTLFPAHLGSFNSTSVDLGLLTAGSYTVAFAGTIGVGDHTTFIDNIRFSTSVADSGSAILLLMASVVILSVLQRASSNSRNLPLQ